MCVCSCKVGTVAGYSIRFSVGDKCTCKFRPPLGTSQHPASSKARSIVDISAPEHLAPRQTWSSFFSSARGEKTAKVGHQLMYMSMVVSLIIEHA